MNCFHHRLPPILGLHPSLLQQRVRSRHHGLVPALDNAVLLRRVRGGEVVLDAFIHAIGSELRGDELPTVVDV